MSPTQHEKQHLEFGGPIGTLLMVAGLPLAILLINLTCNKVSYILICHSLNMN